MPRFLTAIISSLLFCSCAYTGEEADMQVLAPLPDSIGSTGSYAGFAKESPVVTPVSKTTIVLPQGLFQTVLNGPQKRVHTIQFFANRNFLLQEVYPDANDSLVTTTGTWAPSDGFIWLYKGPLAWGRYQWRGDTLQYYQPGTKQRVAMNRLQNILDNQVWKQKPAEGVLLFAIGNEPFWHLEQKAGDSLVFVQAEKGQPQKFKLHRQYQSGDSTVYEAGTDSAALRLVVLPYFCNDGMSDQTYPNKILLQYGGQSFIGCGVKYQ